jgi:uncharacterized membrane protein
MKNRLLTLRDQLSSSYWFLPMVMVVLAMVLSIITIKLDEGIGRDIRWVAGLIYVDSPEGARALLSTVASSMITVAGTVFSLTMVVLSLTSQQYGPFVLSHFMRDRGNQFVLGIFTATFLYCLLILRTVRGVESSIFVPHISVLTGLGLSIASLAVLIYFIHHVSQSIQGPSIIARISDDLSESINKLFPMYADEMPHAAEVNSQNSKFDEQVFTITTDETGYLQMVDDDALIKAASKYEMVIYVDVVPGEYIFKDHVLVRVLPSKPMTGDEGRDIQSAFILGSQRTPTQDIQFTIIQLSALAVRALSSAINDPFTAIMAIDHLGQALSVLLEHDQPSVYRYDQQGHLRLITAIVSFKTLFHTAFDQIAHYGSNDPKVALRLLNVYKTLWDSTPHNDDRLLIQHAIITLYAESQTHLTVNEYQELEEAFGKIIQDFQNQLENEEA